MTAALSEREGSRKAACYTCTGRSDLKAHCAQSLVVRKCTANRVNVNSCFLTAHWNCDLVAGMSKPPNPEQIYLLDSCRNVVETLFIR